jgi:MATE family multidrug resistance protein
VFTDDERLASVAVGLIRIAALFQVFDGIQAVCSGVLRGAGKTRLPFVANLCGQWLIGLPLGLWLARGQGLGGSGLWIGLTIGLVVVGTLLLAKTRGLLRRGVPGIDVSGQEAARRL